MAIRLIGGPALRIRFEGCNSATVNLLGGQIAECQVTGTVIGVQIMDANVRLGPPIVSGWR